MSPVKYRADKQSARILRLYPLPASPLKGGGVKGWRVILFGGNKT